MRGGEARLRGERAEARSIMDREPPAQPEPGSFLSPEEEAELRGGASA